MQWPWGSNLVPTIINFYTYVDLQRKLATPTPRSEGKQATHALRKQSSVAGDNISTLTIGCTRKGYKCTYECKQIEEQEFQFKVSVHNDKGKPVCTVLGPTVKGKKAAKQKAAGLANTKLGF